MAEPAHDCGHPRHQGAHAEGTGLNRQRNEELTWIIVSDTPLSSLRCTARIRIRWRGPRLTGSDWPEPEQAAQEVPSVEDCRNAMNAATDAPTLVGACWHAAWHAAWDDAGAHNVTGIPPTRRAAFIAAMKAMST